MNEERKRGKNGKNERRQRKWKERECDGSLTLSYSLFFEALHNTNKKSLNSSF